MANYIFVLSMQPKLIR